MMNQNFNVSNLSQEQVAALQAFASANNIALTPAKNKRADVDNLKYIDDDHQSAVCVANENHLFEIADIDEETLSHCKKTGLCPDCLHVLSEAENIKSKMVKTRRFSDNRPSPDKAGFQIREAVKNAINNIDDELLENLQDREFCKRFKLSYPLFIEITGKSSDEIKELRKDEKGYTRFSPQVYNINNREFLMTNSLYTKNVQLIENFFNNL